MLGLSNTESFSKLPLLNGVARAFSTVQFPDTAFEFFPGGYENADK